MSSVDRLDEAAGEKLAVAFKRGWTQAARVVSAFRLARNAEQPEETPSGIRVDGF
jgi:hypothetical protein